MLVIGAVVFVLVAALGGGGYWYFTQNNASATSAAWDAVDRNDADALRAFIAGDPGASRAEAEQALADLEERSFEAASDSDTIEAFEAFLNDFPDSEHATGGSGRVPVAIMIREVISSLPSQNALNARMISNSI